MATGFAAAGLTEPLDALNHLNELVTRYCESQMFFAGCSLGIFEALSNGPATVGNLAARLGFHAGAGERLLICLERLGLLTRDGEQYSNSGLADHLTSSAPAPLATLLVWGKLFYPIWGSLENAVRENSPRWQETFGFTQQETFANLYRDADALRRFCGVMRAYSIPQGKLLAETFDFTQHRCIPEVAGGPGGLLSRRERDIRTCGES